MEISPFLGGGKIICAISGNTKEAPLYEASLVYQRCFVKRSLWKEEKITDMIYTRERNVFFWKRKFTHIITSKGHSIGAVP